MSSLRPLGSQSTRNGSHSPSLPRFSFYLEPALANFQVHENILEMELWEETESGRAAGEARYAKLEDSRISSYTQLAFPKGTRCSPWGCLLWLLPELGNPHVPITVTPPIEPEAHFPACSSTRLGSKCLLWLFPEIKSNLKA